MVSNISFVPTEKTRKAAKQAQGDKKKQHKGKTWQRTDKRAKQENEAE